jgi:prepilin-type processing-associated H-X9-DG protein/prepilin-type N-terminal cleavage/methylation domain-containing protein
VELARGRAPGPFCPKGEWGAPRSAFTLVEMMVVVAIILLLSAMLFPVFETALGRAESLSCLSNMRNLGLAARLYADDYDDAIVPAMLSDGNGRRVCWDATIQAYVNNRALLVCPTDERPRQLPGTVCHPHSYGINLELAEVGGYVGSSLRLDHLADPIGTVLFCELNGERYCTHGVRYSHDGLARVATRRHGGGSNYTFADGHAKWLRPEATEAPELLWDP